jgi:hypothetical protein
MVAGLLASMVPGATAGYGVAGAAPTDVTTLTEVIELRDTATRPTKLTWMSGISFLRPTAYSLQ